MIDRARSSDHGASGHGASLLDAVLSWAEPWWDDEVGLLWNMEGAFRDLCPPRTVHLVPPSAFYALGLLVRDGPDDRARAERTIHALLDQQYDEPGTDWHGTFARFAEWPHPAPGAVEFDGYDPNWRQFVGTAFALVLDEAEDRLEPGVAAALERSILLAVEGEPEGRVKPSYSNIALLRSWLDVWAGARTDDVERAAAGELLAGKVVGRFAKTGNFDEYQSPTYYGVDLYALGLWRARSRSALMQEAGLHLEAALWRDLAELFHAGLGNLCGPWDRSYGMDMTSYLGAMGLWWWPSLGPRSSPVPDLRSPFDHSHDLLLGVPAAVLGPAMPEDTTAALQRFPGPHLVERQVGKRRAVTAWLGEQVMVGGSHGGREAADGQHHPAVGHWQLPDGGVGWFRVVRAGPLDAVAAEARLDVSASEGGAPLVLELGLPQGGIDADGVRSVLVTGRAARGRLDLPGAALDLRSNVPVVAVEDPVASSTGRADVVRVHLAASGLGEPARLLLTFV